MKTISGLLIALFVAAVLAGSATSAWAQNKKDKPKVKTYDFSGDTIDGDLVKPDGEFVDARKFATHASLIKVRRDFIREILKSAEDL